MKKRSSRKVPSSSSKESRSSVRANDSTHNAQQPSSPADYVAVLSDMKQFIADSRYRALAFVNRELVCLYWNIGRVIVQQQETAQWGDSVVEQLATDLRMAFPEMKGLSRDNMFRMRKFFVTCRDIDRWFRESFPGSEKVGALRPQIQTRQSFEPIVGALRRQLVRPRQRHQFVGAMRRLLSTPTNSL